MSNFQAPPPGSMQGYPGPAPQPQKRGMSNGLKVLLGIACVCTFGLASCVGIVLVSGVSSNEPESADGVEAPRGAEAQSEVSNGDLGGTDNPYPFGTPHTREAGLLGAGWTLSIDEVRTVGESEFFSPKTEGTCLAVIGTATLDSLESEEELTSNPFSFPQVKMVVAGQEVAADPAACDAEPLRNEGLTWTLDMALTPGSTVKWYEIFRPTTDGSYDLVAIENEVYAEK